MPNPITNFRDSSGNDFGNILITKEYLMSVYPQISNQLITPELWGWGDNQFGQIGNNLTNSGFTHPCTPVTTFAGGSNWKQVACSGRQVTLAIKTDGTLWTWGQNGSNGALGDNTTTNRCTPVTTFAGGTNWKQVSGGGGAPTSIHSAAIKTDGTLWTWGTNTNGQLGDNTTTQRLTPITTFSGGTNWKQVSCGGFHTAAIKTDGTLWTWGLNSYGQLGDNTGTQRNTPVTTFAGGTNWKQVWCGLRHSAAIKTDGTLWTWGQNSYGQLGNNTSGFGGNHRSTPNTTFAGGNNWKQVASASFNTYAIKIDGTLWTWGRNSSGQLGNNTSGSNILTPITTFVGGTTWKQVAGNGNSFTAAIKVDGTLWCWGANGSGQLGNFIFITGSVTPITTFAGGTNWKQVACSESNTVAIRTSDDLQGI